MTVDLVAFDKLFGTLSAIDLTGDGPPAPPFQQSPPTADDVRSAVAPNVPLLPVTYQTGYAAPLLGQVDRVADTLPADLVETVAGAVYQHADPAVSPPLGRFLAVVSNLYRSFLDRKKRLNAGFPTVETIPPVAMFQHSGANGPFTLPVDDVGRAFGAGVAVVSLPSTYRTAPLLWASLAHETGGHDVLHADPGLLPELRDGVRQLFGGGPITGTGAVTTPQFMGALWSSWMDEAASDVYGLLNIGPTFALNLALFFTALLERLHPTGTPTLRTGSGADRQTQQLDPHPTDLLRLDLAIGVIGNLTGLGQAGRQSYISDLETLADHLAPGATTIDLAGIVPVQGGGRITVRQSFPLETMRAGARAVGTFIATATLQALAGHSIQDIETWDDPDERAATAIAAALGAGRPVVGNGDDAQLLAGATLAALGAPAGYDTITTRLAEALDQSFQTDPFWGTPQPDPVLLAAPLEQITLEPTRITEIRAL